MEVEIPLQTKACESFLSTRMKNNIPTKENFAFKEFELARKEFFKNKPKPKNDEEDKTQQEEFNQWYNYIRKQSDTGKTPVEMYKEEYGKEPLEDSIEPSRMIKFEWGEDFKDNAQKEAFNTASELFEEEIWRNEKEDLKEMKRKEVCKYMFVSGFLTYMEFMNQAMFDLKEDIKQNPRKFEETMKKFRKELNN